MHSFTAISAACVVAFGALVSAAPVNMPDVGSLDSITSIVGVLPVSDLPIPSLPLQARDDLALPTPSFPSFPIPSLPITPLPIASPSILPVKARDSTPPSVAEIFTDVWAEITPLVEQLLSITSVNATDAIIGPILTDVENLLGGLISQVETLVGQSTDVILAAVDSDVTLTVDELAELISADLTPLLSAINDVYGLVSADVSADVEALLSDVGSVVNKLLTTVDGIVAGLLAVLSPLLSPVEDVLSLLGLTAVLGFLGL